MVDDVTSRVRAPALALTALGAVGLCVHAAWLLWTVGGAVLVGIGGGDVDEVGTVARAVFQIGGMAGGVMAVAGGRALAAMRRLRWVWIGIAAEAIPCCSGALWPVGLAVAGWAVFVLQDEDVRAAFGDPS